MLLAWHEVWHLILPHTIQLLQADQITKKLISSCAKEHTHWIYSVRHELDHRKTVVDRQYHLTNCNHHIMYLMKQNIH